MASHQCSSVFSGFIANKSFFLLIMHKILQGFWGRKFWERWLFKTLNSGLFLPKWWMSAILIEKQNYILLDFKVIHKGANLWHK